MINASREHRAFRRYRLSQAPACERSRGISGPVCWPMMPARAIRCFGNESRVWVLHCVVGQVTVKILVSIKLKIISILWKINYIVINSNLI
jgi:hypothetical protein